ncbi:GDSL-type esterase/lipase family protein [Streptomyces sp. 135]|uniref:GDSL-type esterase/lipase family protein n=1 Tax=Streptomyces sp. 135 TaxID=2838850 RepID=UPI001CBBA114|nr:GDSL-type esterase/lipase family protein [Streptomyces sp. 135]
MPVHASIGGSRARIRLDNTGNGTAIRIGHATLAHQKTASAAAEHPVSLTFGGRQDVTIAAGGELASDPPDFTVTADEVLLVSIYLPDPVTTVPYHSYTLTTLYSTPKTDHTDRSESIAADTENSPDNLFRRTQDDKYGPRVLVSGVEVTPAAGSGGTVVAIGDSQTDGGHTDLDGNHRWLDVYGRALQASSHPRGVANAGISANQVLKDGSGASMLHRFRHDVLDVPGVKEVIFYGGINDITLSDATATALEKAVTTLAGQAHEAGLTFTAVTLPPFHGYQRFTSSRETTRRQFNAFLRTTQAVDRVVDFDQTSYDPATPRRAPRRRHRATAGRAGPPVCRLLRPDR